MPGTTEQRSAAPAVAVVHGLWLGAWSQSLLARRLRQRGLRPMRFGYPTIRRGLEQNATALAAWARRLHVAELHWVGHSLGGLLVLETLRRYPDLPPGRVVLLGSPLSGSGTARELSRMPGGKRLLGASRPALERGIAPWTGDRAVGVIAGTLSTGAGRLLARLPQPHDGTVSVADTRLRGIAAHTTVRVSHTGLVLSRRVADLTARFLLAGSFAEPDSGTDRH